MSEYYSEVKKNEDLISNEQIRSQEVQREKTR